MPDLTIDDATLVVGVVVALIMLALGMREGIQHRRRLRRLPLRISVNGSRGKSTVTRLLTGALAAGGVRTLGKTTGTEARLVFGWSGDEEDVVRRPEGPNIGEQRAIMARAADEGATAVVAECMAVNPEYQRIFHRDLVDVNVLVITNALEDHLEQMGPTADDVAEVFADSIPRGGVVVVTHSRHLPTFREAALRKDAALLVANPNRIPRDQLRGFDHLVFPDHLAQVYEVTRWLGIPDDIALEGMRWAPPDPFATRLLPIGDPWDPALLVNAFPANDPVSTLGVWDHVRSLGYPGEDLVVIMNCRDDRIERTTLFAEDVLPRLPIDTLLVTGSATRAITRAVKSGDLDVREFHDLTDQPADQVVETLQGKLVDRVVLGVGNLHGGGVEILAALQALAIGQQPEGAH
ncbi:poly-gamma-glutamate synthase PgsB [Salsipaludibacter albus]|uniref:poly-gamma-glutamate synthase PgsB n=1 Tax=Salsipaludibacter albus TaxID=2849650 RepID=UPI001EE3FABA|nr:poly-gamma-glutamate synthase PgsB [Salsipaludibacter albus]MBY5161618.1 poly-gamma-glutamate synthase PgsB [Salsipaludibacter albus]